MENEHMKFERAIISICLSIELNRILPYPLLYTVQYSTEQNNTESNSTEFNKMDLNEME